MQKVYSNTQTHLLLKKQSKKRRRKKKKINKRRRKENMNKSQVWIVSNKQ
jgi:hypothetical protein